jgi:hypothetical protein
MCCTSSVSITSPATPLAGPRLIPLLLSASARLSMCQYPVPADKFVKSETCEMHSDNCLPLFFPADRGSGRAELTDEGAVAEMLTAQSILDIKG